MGAAEMGHIGRRIGKCNSLKSSAAMGVGRLWKTMYSGAGGAAMRPQEAPLWRNRRNGAWYGATSAAEHGMVQPAGLGVEARPAVRHAGRRRPAESRASRRSLPRGGGTYRLRTA